MFWNWWRRRQVVERIQLCHLHIDAVQAVDLAIQLGHHLRILVELLHVLMLVVHRKTLADVAHQW